ncbi:putative flavin-containing monoamine oxidase B [Hyphodiscus hymeniophilus]|uniref:Amine oxidase n=1 Tax=Hyphodiscus hymeniophilus TaxID=353542 RepID=A0A9P6VHR2_9HELO|nr:putative flavin-containing monoamine oxidase B [Hyphodiscus hymeniophilus]
MRGGQHAISVGGTVSSLHRNRGNGVDVDVVVVGAGLSGLKAANDIEKAGFSCVVLEANDRVGGKTLSLPASPESQGVVDLGAAWINDTNQSYMFTLAQKYGIRLEAQRAAGFNLSLKADGTVTEAPYGDPAIPAVSVIDKESTIALARFFRLIDDLGIKFAKVSFQGTDCVEIDRLTLAEFSEKRSGHPIASYMANSLAQGFLGVDSDEISALHFIKYCNSGTGLDNMISDKKDGGQYLRNHSGNQTFSIRMAEDLKPNSVLLNSPVTAIEQTSRDKCIVRSRDRKFTCRKVIVSVPTVLLPKISFIPDLPPAKRLLSESTALGYYAKTIFVFSSPWWRDAGLSGTLQAEHGPLCFSRDTCVPSLDQYSITCFIVGQRGRDWSKLSKLARTAQVLGQFQKMMSSVVEKVPEPINIIEQEWSKHEWFLGAPSPVMAPGVLTSEAGRALREPYQNVHFVGTETSDVWEGYMEGAVRSGERGAAEVVAEL